MTRKTKLKVSVKPRRRHPVAMLPEAPTSATEGPLGDDVAAAWSIESEDVARADVERVDERSPEPIDSAAEAAPDDSTTGTVEAEMADPAEAQAPPHLVER